MRTFCFFFFCLFCFAIKSLFINLLFLIRMPFMVIGLMFAKYWQHVHILLFQKNHNNHNIRDYFCSIKSSLTFELIKRKITHEHSICRIFLSDKTAVFILQAG